MADSIQVGDRVRIHLDSKFGSNQGWFEGTVIRIDPYSEHRSFYWVQLDEDAQEILNVKQLSVLNPKNIQKL
jgi:hypothetical protein